VFQFIPISNSLNLGHKAAFFQQLPDPHESSHNKWRNLRKENNVIKLTDFF